MAHLRCLNMLPSNNRCMCINVTRARWSISDWKLCVCVCVCDLLMSATLTDIKPVILSAHTHTHTHTHTHVGFYGLRGLSIGVMVFYTVQAVCCYCPTPTLHLNLALTGDGAFLFSLKKLTLYDYKHFKLWGHWKCPHKSPSPCNTYVIPMSLYKFVSS